MGLRLRTSIACEHRTMAHAVEMACAGQLPCGVTTRETRAVGRLPFIDHPSSRGATGRECGTPEQSEGRGPGDVRSG